MFHHTCTLGLEGIVRKRKGSHYRSGRSDELAQVEESGEPGREREGEVEWGR
jgi:ATP-dependent DNA ligase